MQSEGDQAKRPHIVEGIERQHHLRGYLTRLHGRTLAIAQQRQHDNQIGKRDREHRRVSQPQPRR